MRAALTKEMMRHFDYELTSHWPDFRQFDSDRGSKTWSWRVAQKLTFFVTVQAISRRDQFVVEIAWNDVESFPWHAMGTIDIASLQGRERLSTLLPEGERQDSWDLSPEKTADVLRSLDALADGLPLRTPTDLPLGDVLPRVPGAVRDAVEKLTTYGMPILRRVAQARGLSV